MSIRDKKPTVVARAESTFAASPARPEFTRFERPSKYPMWPKARRAELWELRQMLYRLATLDRGSNFIDNVKASIKTAKKLTSDSRQGLRRSFIDYAINQALGDKGRDAMTGRFVPPDESARHALWTEIVAAIRRFEKAQPNVRVSALRIMRYADRQETLNGVEIVTRNLS